MSVGLAGIEQEKDFPSELMRHPYKVRIQRNSSQIFEKKGSSKERLCKTVERMLCNV